MRADAPSIALDGVTKRYGAVEAVRGVSFALPQGVMAALVGHNGAGKTTLMKMMLGLARPSAGRLEVLGHDPAAGAAEARRQIGWLPETVSFNGALTGREIIRFLAGLKGEAPRAADRLLDRVGLAAAATRPIGTYSKGMRQRLGLAQALLGEPRLLLLDEPTTGLDPEVRQGFWTILAEATARGTSVLLSSHALEELAGKVSRVIILDHGRVVADGAIDELRRLARLPVRLRVTLAPGAPRGWVPQGADVQPLDGGGSLVDLACPAEEKMAMLARIATAGGATDLDLLPPTLDELYAHFLQDRAAIEARP